MYGTQASGKIRDGESMFENDVNMYGTQAALKYTPIMPMFENDVNMYGTQAGSARCGRLQGLRMM